MTLIKNCLIIFQNGYSRLIWIWIRRGNSLLDFKLDGPIWFGMPISLSFVGQICTQTLGGRSGKWNKRVSYWLFLCWPAKVYFLYSIIHSMVCVYINANQHLYWFTFCWLVPLRSASIGEGTILLELGNLDIDGQSWYRWVILISLGNLVGRGAHKA